MSLENALPRRGENLASQFKELLDSETTISYEQSVFNNLEETLTEVGFSLGDTSDVLGVIYDDTLVCRSESFTRTLSALDQGNNIELSNQKNRANMCIMASGKGFKTAMQEGFSGKDVGGVVKVVISFAPQHLDTKTLVNKDDDLWRTKPETAQVSLVGNGLIELEDIKMISFRFPVKYFPENLLSEDEKNQHEEDKIGFIVRHYLPIKKETLH